MMEQVQPVNDRVPLVNADGTPTQAFIRLLQERGLLTDEKITAEQAQQLIDDFAAGRDINTVAPLSGGGNLSSDRTLSLDVSGVTPGSYTNTDLTVDAFGRITAAANGSGGGGGGAFGEFAQSPPLASLFPTTINAVGCTTTTVNVTGKGLAMTLLTGAGRGSAIVKAAPSLPFTVTARATGWVGMGAVDIGFGITLRNSANGRMVTNYVTNANAAFNFQQWSDPTTFNATLATSPNQATHATVRPYFAIHVTAGGSIQAYYSMDGANWELLGTTTIGTYLLALDQVGLWTFGATGGRRIYSLWEFYREDEITPPAVAL